MSHQRGLDRGLAIRKYGSSCHCCGQGPLVGRGLYLEPIGFPDVANIGSAMAPACGRCSKALETTTFGKHLDNLRRQAKLALKATRQRANEAGQDLPLFVESDRYD